jgi:hypothetical protein
MLGPGIPVADDIEPPSGTRDGDIEQIGPQGRPALVPRASDTPTKHKDDDVGLAALGGVDRAGGDPGIGLAIAGEPAGDVTKRSDEEHLCEVRPMGAQLAQEPLKPSALLGNPVPEGPLPGNVQPRAAGQRELGPIG